MHRVDTDAALPGGLFTDGNPAVGQQGTIFNSDWLNDLQENICQVVEHAGIALVKGDYSQLTQAITQMVAGIVGTGGGAVPTTRKVQGGGLVTGGSTLDVDVTLSVAVATAAAIIAGMDNASAVTPAALAAAIGPAATDSDTIFLPGGRIIKLGGYLQPITAEGQIPINFATPFPTACDRVFLTGINATAAITEDMWPQLVSKTKTGFIAFMQWPGAPTTGKALDGFDYIAWGR